MKWEAPGRIRGRVSGSRSNVYSVVPAVEAVGGGALLSPEDRCSCPVGFDCKHVAAVLLAAEQFPADGTGLGSGTEPGPVAGKVREGLTDWRKRPTGGAEDRCGG